MLHPEVAYRDCEHCQLYTYDEDSGLPVLHNGQPLRRDRAERPPCRTKTGCFKGTPEVSKALSAKNLLCYRHYLRCRATGSWPLDPLVAYHARLLAEVERECSEAKQLDALQSTMQSAILSLRA